jgi:anti-anti-sigma regulatory factor
MASDVDDERLRAALRDALARTPGMATETSTRIDALVAEFMPFTRCAITSEGASPEARSLAWLFAYRLGDQSLPPLAATASLFAWRDLAATPAAQRVVDEVLPLVLDGYARAREDRAKAELQRTLGEALPVAVVAPGLVLAIAAGPLDADAARALADRAGRLMLQAEARAVLVDMTGLHDPDAATVSELWAVTSSARMLGAFAMVAGESSALVTALEGAGASLDGVGRAPTLVAALEVLGRDHGVSLAGHENWVSRAFAYVRSAPWSGRSGR